MQEKLGGFAERLLGRINRLEENSCVPYDNYQDIKINDIQRNFIENLISSTSRQSENKI